MYWGFNPRVCQFKPGPPLQLDFCIWFYIKVRYKNNHKINNADVAQLARVPPCHGGGYEFEPRYPLQINLKVQKSLSYMANKHGLKWNIVKKQAASRKMAKNKKAAMQNFIWNENAQARKNTSFKQRKHYYENKMNFPKKKLLNKDVNHLIEIGLIDERGFFVKWKKKNFITKSMTDAKGLDFYGMPRAK